MNTINGQHVEFRNILCPLKGEEKFEEQICVETMQYRIVGDDDSVKWRNVPDIELGGVGHEL